MLFVDEVVNTPVLVGKKTKTNYNSAPATLSNVSVTYHSFLQQVQAHFISSATRLTVILFAWCPQFAGPRPMLKASQSFEYRDPIGRVISVIAIIEHTRSRQVRDLCAES